MKDVHILDSVVANQIAAGEVVEKPASVVKELVENSLDAGATKIEVTIFEGGTEYIRVADNGSGMSPENATVAVLRHATSKLAKAEDLLQLMTLGFRGEALPSIASVSKFQLLTRTADTDMGVCVRIEGGGPATVSETGADVGTSVIVEDLFYNVPARRKFLKTVGTEGRYISELLTHLALGRPDVAFRLQNGEKEVLATSGDGDLKSVIRSLYGKEVAGSLLPVDYELEGVRVTGFVSKPTLLKNSRQWQTVFVNGRNVSGRMLTKAIDHAYQSMIPKSGFPFAVLNIDLDRSTVDVNVHPQKAEVKFSDEGLIYRSLYHALTNALTKPYSAVKASLASSQAEYVAEPKDSNSKTTDELPLFRAAEPVVTYRSAVEPTVSYHPPAEPEVPFGQVVEELKKADAEAQNISVNFFQNDFAAGNVENAHEAALNIWPIGQVDKTFIIAQSENCLYLVDQHAAHERVLYDKLVAAHGKVDMQTLLVPVYVDMDEEELELMTSHQEQLLQFGLDVEQGGAKMLRINGLPVDILPNRCEEFLREIAALFKDNRVVNPAELRAEVLHMTACKAAIKAGQDLNMRQMRDLLLQLCNTEHPFTCPHGRPCMIEINSDELYKMFKRTGF